MFLFTFLETETKQGAPVITLLPVEEGKCADEILTLCRDLKRMNHENLVKLRNYM